MKPWTHPKPGYDKGVSEVLGVIFLVSLVVLAFGIVSLVLVSQPQKEQIPEINTVISNLTNSTTGQNLVYITHTGGDYLQTGQYMIFINHVDRTSNITTINGDTNNSEWNAGETLVINTGSETPYLVQIYYKGATTTALLVEHSLSSTSPFPTQPPPNPGYWIISSSVSGTGGSINPLGTLYVPNGSSQGYSIINDTGYHVSGVVVDGVPLGALTTYIFPDITSNHQISATFAINTYQINASSGPNGAITPAGTNIVNYGATPTYTITPNPGYHVADVLVNGVSVGAVTTYTFPPVTENETISATFMINGPLSIIQLTPSSATAGGDGFTLTVNGTGYTSSSKVNWNGVSRSTTYVSSTQLTATIPVSDITSAGTANITVFNPPEGTTSNIATFTINPQTYTITPSISSGNGVISPGTAQIINYGSTPTFMFIPDIGYYLSTVTVDGSTVTLTGNNYTFPAVTASHTIVATFAISTYTIIPSVSGGNGVISPGTAQTVNYGDTPTFTFIPDAGYYLNTVTVDGKPVKVSGINYTFPAVTDNHNIVGTFTLNPPAVTSISPASGPLAGGTSVTITGTGFSGVTGAKFGSTAASSFIVNSATLITATSPMVGSAGTVDITITSSGGTSAIVTGDQFTYITSPVVTSISPASGPLAGGTSVTITGTGFSGATGVKFGSTAASSFIVNSATLIAATSPAVGSAGTVDITITTPGGISAIVTGDQFTYAAAPTVSGITPISGNRGTSVSITNLAGSGFKTGATVKLARTGQSDIVASSVSVVSSTKITCTFNLTSAAAGQWNVIVSNPDQQSGTLANGFTVNSPAPTLTARSPTSGNRGWPVNITLTGTGFQPGATPSMSRSGSNTITAFNIAVLSSTQITCSFDLAGATAAKDWAISVTNTDGQSSGTVSFTITSPSPTVASILPASGQHGTQVAITNIAGTGFQPGAVVLFATNSGMNQNTMSLTNVNVVSSTQIVGLLNIPSAQSINTYYIRVTNTDGNSGRSNAKIFNVV